MQSRAAKENMTISSKNSMCSLYNPAVALLGSYYGVMKTSYKTCTLIFMRALFTITLQTAQLPFNELSKPRYIHIRKYYSLVKRTKYLLILRTTQMNLLENYAGGIKKVMSKVFNCIILFIYHSQRGNITERDNNSVFA